MDINPSGSPSSPRRPLPALPGDGPAPFKKKAVPPPPNPRPYQRSRSASDCVNATAVPPVPRQRVQSDSISNVGTNVITSQCRTAMEKEAILGCSPPSARRKLPALPENMGSLPKKPPLPPDRHRSPSEVVVPHHEGLMPTSEVPVPPSGRPTLPPERRRPQPEIPLPPSERPLPSPFERRGPPSEVSAPPFERTTPVSEKRRLLSEVPPPPSERPFPSFERQRPSSGGSTTSSEEPTPSSENPCPPPEKRRPADEIPLPPSIKTIPSPAFQPNKLPLPPKPIPRRFQSSHESTNQKSPTETILDIRDSGVSVGARSSTDSSCSDCHAITRGKDHDESENTRLASQINTVEEDDDESGEFYTDIDVEARLKRMTKGLSSVLSSQHSMPEGDQRLSGHEFSDTRTTIYESYDESEQPQIRTPSVHSGGSARSSSSDTSLRRQGCMDIEQELLYANMRDVNMFMNSLMEVSTYPIARLRDKIHPKSGARTTWADMPEVLAMNYLDRITKEEEKVQEHLFEILSSEIMFYKKMRSMSLLYRENRAIRYSLTDKQHLDVFGNIDEIIAASHCLLLRLEALWTINCHLRADEICEILQWAATQRFHCYIKYLASQNQQCQDVDRFRCSMPAFQQAVDNAESSPESCGDKLKAFLIFPVQRAMRYPLLLREVERVTSDPQQLERVQRCLHHFEKIAKEGNVKADETANLQDLVRITNQLKFEDREIIPIARPFRYLIKEGEIKCVHPTKCKLYVYVFNDLVLVTKKKSDNPPYTVLCHGSRQFVLAEEVSPQSIPRSFLSKGSTKVKNTFELLFLKEKTKYIAACQSERELKSWLDPISPTTESDGAVIYAEYARPTVKAIYPCEGADDKLSLALEDEVIVHRDGNDGWSVGEKVSTGQVGQFLRTFTHYVKNEQSDAIKLRKDYLAAREYSTLLKS